MESSVNRRVVLGGAVASLVSLMAGAAPPRKRSFADDPRYKLTDRLCELVIPATDTPGGSGAGSADFVLLALDRSMEGLNASFLERVSQHLNQAAGGQFLEITPARQEQLLAGLDAGAFATTDEATHSEPERAWKRLKSAIVAGYYTSQIGAEQELVFEPVPGPERRNFTLTADYRSRSNEGFGGTL